MRTVEILDTTLRDGEQTNGVSFSSTEKMHITRILLEELMVDRVELASAKVSNGEFETVRKVARWATSKNLLNHIEILGFVDGNLSLDWISSAGCKVMNLLCKGSLRHCEHQLRKTPEQHLDDIASVLKLAEQRGVEVNVYLEDWSNGMIHSPNYVYAFLDRLRDAPIRRFMLPDTLGILNPSNTAAYCRLIIERYPNLHFDFHAHNDYDLAVANTFAAASEGVHGIHVTVNGLGERAGNAPLTSVIAMLHDQLKIGTHIVERTLNQASRIVESYSGIRVPHNKPVIGDNVFTQCAGIHADGDNKNKLYYNDLLPERFGRTREYALGKNSGKANIRKNLENLGIDLDEDSMRKLTQRVIELGDKKEIVTPEDLPYIISDVLHQDVQTQKIKILNYSLSLTQGLKPVATLKLQIDSHEYEETATGDGQYDAFVRALRRIYKSLNRTFPMLVNYAVSIPPGGRTDALVQTVITWQHEGLEFKTRGLDADQMEAAIEATIKMLNKIEQ
jgi:D-citramalate synthase